MREDDIYGTGLARADWSALASLVNPYLNVDLTTGKLVAPGSIDNLGDVPPHLAGHPVVELIRQYRGTGDEGLLDRAGQALVPGSKDWYVVLSK
jgi:hypothetical protein